MPNILKIGWAVQKIWPWTRDGVARDMRLGRHFPLYNYIGQNGPKMTKNGHIFPKNDPNHLKFWHKMYLGGFYQFLKFRQNRPKNPRFLAKNGHFCRNSVMLVEKKFSAENRTCPREMLQLALKLVGMYHGVISTTSCTRFWISGFFPILWMPKCAERAIFGKKW